MNPGTHHGERWTRRPDRINRGWRYTILTNHHRPYEPAVTDADIPAIRDVVLGALRGSRDYGVPGPCGDDLKLIVDMMEDVATVGEFDQWLRELYDWGDDFRVIIDGGRF